MKPASFGYVRAASAEQAVALLREHGDGARLIAGGQSLVPMMNFRIARPEVLIDLNSCTDLAYIRREDQTLTIGAMTRQRTIEQSPEVHAGCRLLSMCVADAGPVAVRNRGTLGGMLSNCYPAADLVAAMLCVDAEMVVLGAAGIRRVAAADFFLGPFTTALAPGEMLLEARVPCPPGHRYFYRKLSDHRGGAATLAVAMAGDVTKGDAPILAKLRVAALGLDSIAMRLPRLERSAILRTRDVIIDAVTQDMRDRGSDQDEQRGRDRLLPLSALVEEGLASLVAAAAERA